MDLQEMNDVTAPLLNQKELEAEALRLQIQMRDRMIADQDQLVSEEGAALLQKPDGWLEILAKPSRRMPSPLNDDDEDDPELGVDTVSPPRRSVTDRNPPRSNARSRPSSQESPPKRPPVTLPPLSPGRGQINRPYIHGGKSEPSLAGPSHGSPHGSPPRGPVVTSGVSAASGGRRSRPPSASAQSATPGGQQAPAGGSATPVADTQELPPLDIAGRGLGHGRPPRLCSDAVEAAPGAAPISASSSAPPRTPSPLELRGHGPAGGTMPGGDQTRLPQSRSPAPTAATPPAGSPACRGGGGGDSDLEYSSDQDLTTRGLGKPRNPVRKDSARRGTKGANNGVASTPNASGPYAAAAGAEARGRLNGAPAAKRRGRKSRRGGEAATRGREREREREGAQRLHIEASGLHREREDSQGSDSERDATPKDPSPVQAAVAAAERKGILDKLNRRPKPAGNPKHLC